MSYATQQPIDNRVSNTQDTASLEPSLLMTARKLYSSYCKTHTESPRRPVGVVIGRGTQRGQLVFKDKPVLLFHECFVPFEQIEAGEPPAQG